MQNRKFSQILRTLRKQRRVTQRELAEKLSYGSSAISNYEAGKNQPSIPDLIKLSEYFNVSVGYLIGANEPMAIDIKGIKDEIIIIEDCIHKIKRLLPEVMTYDD